MSAWLASMADQQDPGSTKKEKDGKKDSKKWLGQNQVSLFEAGRVFPMENLATHR